MGCTISHRTNDLILSARVLSLQAIGTDPLADIMKGAYLKAIQWVTPRIKGLAEHPAGRKNRNQGTPGPLSIQNRGTGFMGFCLQMTNAKHVLAF